MTLRERPPSPPGGWRARHLLGVDDLSDEEIRHVLDLTHYYAGFVRQGLRPPQTLSGKTQVNLFYEDSTRTNLSFELAGKKLGADVINVPVAASSVNKGESLLDTVQTLGAMGAAAMIIRHKERGVQRDLAARSPFPIINGGDGAGEHPTQALLDAATIEAAFGSVDGRIIAICGDIRHSRVAGSGARLLQRLGGTVRFVGPASLMPDRDFLPEIARFDRLADGLDRADIAMGLRMQFERMGEAGVDAADGYYQRFGLTHGALAAAAPGARVMHPGPMNRGVEIDGALADDPERSLILAQVFHGVPLRMAALDALVNRPVTDDRKAP